MCEEFSLPWSRVGKTSRPLQQACRAVCGLPYPMPLLIGACLRSWPIAARRNPRLKYDWRRFLWLSNCADFGQAISQSGDRKSVVWGKSVYVRVDLGGGGII